MAEKDSKPDMLTQERVKALGFTASMISKLLPEPILKPNPRYRNSRIKLWPVEQVETVMQTEEFAQLKEKADKRRLSAAKATKTKREKTRADFAERIAAIKVRPIPLKRARRIAVEEQEARCMMRGDYDAEPKKADAQTKKRWTVSFIRHELTDYDRGLYEAKGSVGMGEEYVRYKNAVLDAIAKAYPSLAEECRRQQCVYRPNPPKRADETLDEYEARLMSIHMREIEEEREASRRRWNAR